MSQIDPSSRFLKYEFNQGELAAAQCINHYNMAYLQNKIADYAEIIVSFEFDSGISLEMNFMKLEKIRAQLAVLEELAAEMTIPDSNVN